ncbi:hypothetical protein HYE26_02060 [Mycoplasmopsis bovis]|nr:hypothetical protein [Mycoplasmopsis bovis]QQH23251.1 hypothetical protein HYE26_02060 [Mycoplasmopsis bovis]
MKTVLLTIFIRQLKDIEIRNKNRILLYMSWYNYYQVNLTATVIGSIDEI